MYVKFVSSGSEAPQQTLVVQCDDVSWKEVPATEGEGVEAKVLVVITRAGVETRYFLSSLVDNFVSAFVMSEAGKTIDRVRFDRFPREVSEAAVA